MNVYLISKQVVVDGSTVYHEPVYLESESWEMATLWCADHYSYDTNGKNTTELMYIIMEKVA